MVEWHHEQGDIAGFVVGSCGADGYQDRFAALVGAVQGARRCQDGTGRILANRGIVDSRCQWVGEIWRAADPGDDQIHTATLESESRLHGVDVSDVTRDDNKTFRDSRLFNTALLEKVTEL